MNTNASSAPLCDKHSRSVSYLRFSVTDRCNLRCIYCRGLGREEILPHDSLLRYEEILRLVRLVCGLGITKVRLTGGEPFARRDIASLIMSLREHFPALNLRLTTNGTLVRPHIGLLKDARVDAVNLSIDSFDRATFAKLTGFDLLPEVLAVLEGLLDAGLRVKINAVAMRGVTDKQLPAFVEAVRRWPVDLRFIEFMPMGAATVWNSGQFLPADELQRSLQAFVDIAPDRDVHQDHGPARMFKAAGLPGRIGFITALSHHFCATCNRLRITSDGSLRTCLFADTMTPLRSLLRDPAKTDADIADCIRKALADKPIGAELLQARKGVAVARGQMARIGG